MVIVCEKYMGTTQIRYCPKCGAVVSPADRPLPCKCGFEGLVANWTTQGYVIGKEGQA